MKSFILALAFVGTSAFAGTNGYDIKIDMSLNGKHISSPQFIVKEGLKASMTQKNESQESFIEVIATEGTIQNNKGILMTFVVGTIDRNGQKIVTAQPQILAKENVPAKITVGTKDGNQLSMSVIANRKSL